MKIRICPKKEGVKIFPEGLKHLKTYLAIYGHSPQGSKCLTVPNVTNCLLSIVSAPAMVSVTATKQIADFPSPLSEPTTRRFPPAAAGNRFQVIRNVNIAPALNSSPNASDSKEVILSSSKSSSSSPERESSVMKTENLNAPSNLAVLVDSNEAKGKHL